MQPHGRHGLYTIEEYLRLEAYSNVKHEFHDGQIFAMGGGTPEHAAMAGRIAVALANQLRGRRCIVYPSDLRVRVVATGLDTYPDVSVVCGELQRDSQDRNASTNPVVLVEVLSPGTEVYDRSDKLDHYKQIPSLQEVVLVSHREPLVEVWRRDATGWSLHASAAGQSAELASISCALEVDDIYRDPLALNE